MTDRLALFFGILLIAAIAGDLIFYDGETLLFLSKKFLDLIEWIAFWR